MNQIDVNKRGGRQVLHALGHMGTVKARVYNREDITVHVVRDEGALPHTARYVGACAYKGFCPRLWRCEGRYYMLLKEKEECDRWEAIR